MDILTLLISRVNDVLWTYILIIMLLGCAFWFTFKTNFVQFRMIREMIRLLGDSTGKTEGREHHISSFQEMLTLTTHPSVLPSSDEYWRPTAIG